MLSIWPAYDCDLFVDGSDHLEKEVSINPADKQIDRNVREDYKC